MDIVNKAISLALRYHAGAINNHDGELYLLHVHRVASNFNPVEDVAAAATAWLHDVVEDTDLTMGMLRAELLPYFTVGNLVGDAVEALTKIKGQPNEDYYWRVKANRLATRVKLADLTDNFGRNHLIEDEAKRARLAHKYSLGFEILARQT